MTDGLAIRVTITVLTVIQAMLAALLGFADILPQWAKVALVVVSTGIAVALNQVPSWSNAPAAARALKAKNAD